MKNGFHVWQITFPLSVVLIFALGSLTAAFLIEGRYLFNLEVTPKQLKIQTDIDKREVPVPENETSADKRPSHPFGS